MKKAFVSFLFLFCIISAPPVYAARQFLVFPADTQTCYYHNGIIVTIAETQPWHTINKAGHTYFPIRIVSELFGFQVQWQPDTQTIQLSDEERMIVLTVNSPVAVVNQQEQTIGIAPILQEDTMSYNIIYEDGEAIPLVSLYKQHRFYTEYGVDYLRLQKMSTDWGSSSTVYLYQLTDKTLLPIARLASEDRNTYVIMGDWCFSVEHYSGIDYLIGAAASYRVQ